MLRAKKWTVEKEFKDTTDGLLKIQYALADSCKKYEQALQEIREIADENIDTAQYYGICNSILAKVNEVIGAENEQLRKNKGYEYA